MVDGHQINRRYDCIDQAAWLEEQRELARQREEAAHPRTQVAMPAPAPTAEEAAMAASVAALREESARARRFAEVAMAFQNRCRCSRRPAVGRPGERMGAAVRARGSLGARRQSPAVAARRAADDHARSDR